jgi:hypothetical protein
MRLLRLARRRSQPLVSRVPAAGAVGEDVRPRCLPTCWTRLMARSPLIPPPSRPPCLRKCWLALSLILFELDPALRPKVKARVSQAKAKLKKKAGGL